MDCFMENKLFPDSEEEIEYKGPNKTRLKRQSLIYKEKEMGNREDEK